ncbi:hypothetical protein [uncultured Mucilaginibacter sp.]|uniref:hypothetical protein n=1 Tax=uncultured Mucilaginibacter sp. TaxID=797541 RepID=UPI0025F1903B|nr:hypothetical protein [uncultured Mucilaginibacter sp.]
MSKIIEVDKSTSRIKLDEAIKKLPKRKAPINIDKYFGKINFGIDGLTYQFEARDEWR